MSREQIEGFGERILSRPPFGHVGGAGKIVAAVAFLPSDDASVVHAHEPVADGGMSGRFGSGVASRSPVTDHGFPVVGSEGALGLA